MHNDERRLIYNKHLHTPEGSYVNFLMYLAGFSYFPRRLLRLPGPAPAGGSP